MNIGSIVGPPYAIFSIKPALGPMTGKTKIRIFGDGFKQSANIAVKFLNDRGFEEVQATYVNEKELTCETPSYETFGPRQSDVYVSINKGDYTITKA